MKNIDKLWLYTLIAFLSIQNQQGHFAAYMQGVLLAVGVVAFHISFYRGMDK